jgi:hypothetical protein
MVSLFLKSEVLQPTAPMATWVLGYLFTLHFVVYCVMGVSLEYQGLLSVVITNAAKLF